MLIKRSVLMLLISMTQQAIANEKLWIEQLIKHTRADDRLQKELRMLPITERKMRAVFQECFQLPLLFRAYPELEKTLSYISLGNYPTPIQFLVGCSYLCGDQIYIKFDSMAGGTDVYGHTLFGGNKVRKLEFLLADALEQGACCVMTFGCAGSNHVTATAAYAQFLGLDCISMLKDQHNAHVVRRNLKLMQHYGSYINYYPTFGLRCIGAVTAAVKYQQEHGSFPYVIPTGGSCAMGAIGFVHAAFELKEQIAQGMLPEPEYIYVPAGSLGTAAGLLLGCKAAGLSSKVVAVAVEPDSVEYFEGGIKRLFHEINQLLHERASSFPLFDLAQEDVVVLYDSAGDDYALFTEDAVKWMKLLMHDDNIKLDGTYTGKAFAGMMRDLQRPEKKGKNVLFWNTFDGNDFSDIIDDIDYHDLPKSVHKFFEKNVQPLDQL